MGKKKEYLVKVSIIEGRHLRSTESVVNPFVKISVANLLPQVTTVAKATATATWNQSFTFSDVASSLSLIIYCDLCSSN